MKIVEKLLYFIASLVALLFLVMLVCMINPDVNEALSDLTNKIAENREEKAREAEEAEEAAANPGAPSEAADEGAEATEPGSEETALETTTESGSMVRRNSKPYDEYVSGWTDDGISDEYLNDDTYDDFADALTEGSISGLTGDYDEDELRRAYENSNESRADYEIPEAEVEIVKDEDEAAEVVKDTTIGETGKGLDFDPLFYPYYNILNDKGKRLYNQIYANAVALNESFLPVEDATGAEWDNAMFSVVYDHPELFWMDTSLYTQYDYNGNVIKLSFHYYDEIPDIPAAKEKFEASAQEMIAGAKDLESDYEKEKYIHDLLDNKLTYDFAELNQSAYSAIVYDTTVCAGYSKGFQYLMQQLGVPTYTCVGWGGFGILFGGMHGWNIIKLDDDFYNVDCTWDDAVPVGYEYFNLSDADNDMHTRMFNSVYLPPCNGSKYSGLEKNSLADYGFTAGDVLTSMDEYYAYCRDKTLNTSERYDENSFECLFDAVISKDLYDEWKRAYSNADYYDAYLSDVINTLGNGDQYDFFIPIGLVICDEEELSDGSYLILHGAFMGWAAMNF